jgi:TrpR family trp operon transcriptional repressor
MSKSGWRDFIELCMSTESPEMLSDIFDLFLTPEEKSSIDARFLIVKALLEKKKTQRNMAEDLKVSIAKITRGSNELKRISTKLTHYLQKHLSKHN